MDRVTFFKHIADAFAFRDGEPVNASALFKEHRNWGSITSLLTISMFFSEYDVHISADELVACETFADLFQIVAEKRELECTA